MEDPILVAVAAVAVSFLCLFAQSFLGFRERRLVFTKQGVPMGPDSHWFFGHLFTILQADFRKTTKWGKASANQYGQVCFWAGFRLMLYVYDLKDAKTVLNKEHERYRPPLVQRHIAMVNGKRGLLALNGKDWKLHRAAVTRTFNPDFLSGARGDMMDVTISMVQSIQKKIRSAANNNNNNGSSTLELDVEPLMKMITLDIFGKTALNVDLQSCEGDLQASPMANAFEYLLEQFMLRMRSPFKPQHFFYWIPTEQNRRQIKERNFLRSFLRDLINEKRKAQRENPGAAIDKDLLSHLLKAHNDVQDMPDIVEAHQVTDDNLTDIVMSLFVAGFDTTSITLATSLYLLAQHPQVQQTCVEEIQKVKGDLVDPENLAYCKAVIWEALRMYPPAVIVLRTMSKPITLNGGLVVPKGTDITIPIYGIHHDESIFPRPEEFRPDRWVSKDKTSSNDGKEGRWVERTADDANDDDVSSDSSIPAGNRSAMLAFSAGGRNCVGMKFATTEAVIVLANLLKGLEVKPVPGFELKTSTKSLLHKPDNGVFLNVSVRSDQK